MNNENLMKIAVYVWEIRKAANARALGRDSLEKAILELEELRNKVQAICRRCRKPNILSLGATVESLMDMTENDIHAGALDRPYRRSMGREPIPRPGLQSQQRFRIRVVDDGGQSGGGLVEGHQVVQA